MNKNNLYQGKALPDGWRLVRLGEIYKISASGDLDLDTFSKIKSKEFPHPVYSNALTNNGLHGYSSHTKFRGDSVTITARGYIGKANYRDTAFIAIGRVLVLENMIPISNRFVCEFINHKLRFAKETTGVPQLTAPQASKYFIALPPLSEQKSIATFLQTWDDAIEKTEGLVTAKEKRFKYLLKTLITDQQANRNWERVKLGDIVRIQKGTQINRVTLTKTGLYPVLNGGINPSGYTDKWNTPENTVTICEGGSCGFVIFTAHKFWAGAHCYVLTVTGNLDNKFLFYCLKSCQDRIMRLRVGSCIPNIQRGDLDNFPIYTPLDIQTGKTIAIALDKCRQEIDILQQLAEKYRTQKRGLMQKLLTGEWRVG